jgi:GT2 family glycosyltransferase
MTDRTLSTAHGPGPVAFVAIGRNEGRRLEVCLTSLKSASDRVVYVDSGSTDGSVAFARSIGAEVVELDMSTPFTAARARNAGYAHAKATWPDLFAVHFIDGDCELVTDWLPLAVDALSADEKLGIVAGWLKERHRDDSVYNMMCDVEWHQPAGPMEACGGIMLVRVRAFDEVSGFNPKVIAAEDDEFCLRVREAGYRLERLPHTMALHDAAMTRFSEWWQRAVRAGHAFAQLGALHGDYFAAERRRALVWGAVLPGLALVGLFVFWPATLLILALYGAQFFKTYRGLRQSRGLDPRDAGITASFLSIVKVPNFLGMLTYWRRRRRGDAMTLIEYK